MAETCVLRPIKQTGRLFAAVVIALVLTSAAHAVPITYVGFTITDGQLGTWQFKHARVYLRFKGDTNNVQFTQITDQFGSTADVYLNTVGTATVTIITPGQTVRATFAANQIFVSLDQGDSSFLPHIGGRGVGFSSFTATGIEPAYPLGIEDGTIDYGDYYFDPSTVPAAFANLSTDLMHDTAFSGRAWICVGFPTFGGPCGQPNPLQTDKGALVLYQPYQQLVPGNPMLFGDPLNAGFFFTVLGSTDDVEDE